MRYNTTVYISIIYMHVSAQTDSNQLPREIEILIAPGLPQLFVEAS